MKIIVVGASAAGLLAALFLARAGHQVIVVEQDGFDVVADLESAAATAFRPAAPQIVQPHAIMARGRELLRDRLPDLYARLLAAGVTEAPLSAFMSPALADRSPRPGDERLGLLLTRRSTVDWVLRRTALHEPGIELRPARVLGLIAQPGEPPRVTGVRTGAGQIQADLVVDAAGRRSPLDRWLAEAGARPPATWRAECGLAYFGRHYRLRPGARTPGPAATRLVVALAEFTAVLFGADNGAMQLAVAPLAADHRFRTVRAPGVFTAVLRTIPAFAAWLEVLDPISPVYPMGGLHNTLRRLVAGGVPVVTGLHAVGDSVCTTNPTLGRGLTLALQGAADLAEVLAWCPGAPATQALALDDLIAEHVAPYYADQAAIDGRRLAMLRHAVFGTQPPDRAAPRTARHPRTARQPRTASPTPSWSRPPPSTRWRSARSGGSRA